MCGIAGVLDLCGQPIPELSTRLHLMSRLQRHRGPDGAGMFEHPRGHVGLAHVRLSIIDLDSGAQPMTDGAGNWVTYNGEIYNYLELRDELGAERFRTRSDTEVLLHGFRKAGTACLDALRGMFAFALWDEQGQALVLARDRFGIKPLYWAKVGDRLYFASEIKALLPFLPQIETDVAGLKDYFAFQFCIAGKTLFQGVHELLPGHFLVASNGTVRIERYWEVFYELDFEHTERWFQGRIDELLMDSVRLHLRADVPIGAYVSGGLDSSLVASLAALESPGDFVGFNGRFLLGPEYDESAYARSLGEWRGFPILEADIGVADFVANIERVIYHLDFPVAGPGSFPQFMTSALASQHRKVVLGGQGGDEIFGGYARYLIAYFEQCIKAAIDGTAHNGNFIVTYESIIPNLTALRSYKPLLQEFWRDGLFEDLDRRYYRLVNRSNDLRDEVRWEELGDYSPFETFRSIFRASNVQKESYFDSMTHFDFKTLLPALLQVEDRVSMAHGLEARVPLLDHPLVELAATIPSNVKFQNGTMKHVFREVARRHLPPPIVNRKDKMGFPVPLVSWLKNEAHEFVCDLFSSRRARERPFVDNTKVLDGLAREPQFSRKIWGLLSLELWQRAFHDRAHELRSGAPRI